MSCNNCGSERILSVSGKCSDMFGMSGCGIEKDGYVPSGICIGGGDYMSFAYCLECGMIQDDFPVKTPDSDV